MKKVLLYLLAIPILVLSACNNDDEDPPPNEVGVWELQGFILRDFPSDYSRWEGSQLPVDAIFAGVDSYTLELKADNTYELEIEAGLDDATDEGTWTLEDEELVLESDDSAVGDLVWDVIENEEDDLTLSEQATFLWPSNADVDALLASDEYVNGTEAERDSLFNALDFDPVQHAVHYIFERGSTQ